MKVLISCIGREKAVQFGSSYSKLMKNLYRTSWKNPADVKAKCHLHHTTLWDDSKPDEKRLA